MIAYDRLSNIIPPDQALANKALSVSMQSITGISTMSLAQFANAVGNVQTMANLPLVANLTQPVSPAASTAILSTIGTGTGANGTVTINDMLGTAGGYISANAITNCATIINSMTNLGGLTGIYNTMYTTVTGGYGTGPVTIPGPAAGTYTNINSAFTGEPPNPSANITGGPGLLAVANSSAAAVVAGDPADVAKLNSNTTAIINQLITEKTNQKKATLDFGNLTPNSTTSIYSLTMSLPSYGQDTNKNGTAQFIQSVANTQVLAGQAIIATMRQGQTNISTSAISTNANVPYTPATPPPQATLLPAQYPYPQPVKN